MKRELYKDIVALIVPYMDDRRSLFQEAYFGTVLLEKIDWDGGNRQFANNAVRQIDQFGMIDGKPAVVPLLQTLRKQVGHDKAAQIDSLVSRVMDETSTPSTGDNPPSTPVQIIAAVVVVTVLVIGGIGAMIYGVFGQENSPEQPPTQPATLIAQEGPNRADFTLIFEGENGLTLSVNEFSDLNALTLASADTTVQLADILPELDVFGGMPPTNTCFRLVREGTSPPLPSACSGAEVFEASITDADVFWYNDLENRVNSLAVRYNGSNLKVCTSATPRCDVVAELGEQNND